MNFGDKLKDIRKKRNLSQEQLADEIGVSRQAITKWETNRGMPDIENIKILSEIFKMSLDELIYEEYKLLEKQEFISTSEVAYDIDSQKKFELKMIKAKKLLIQGGDEEKLRIILSSKTIENLDTLYKMKVEEQKKKIDIICISKTNAISYDEEEHLYITMILPKSFSNHFEVEAKIKDLVLENLYVDRLEFDGKSSHITICNSEGSFEFTSKDDIELVCDNWQGKIDICQFHAKTILHIPHEQEFSLIDKNRKGKIQWKHNHEIIEPIIRNSDKSKICIQSYKSETIIDLVDK